LEQQKFLLSKRVSYGGEVVSVRRELIAEKVIAAWPKIGEACVCPIISFVDEHLRDELLNPDGVLLPRTEWPAETPRSKVCCDDSNWYSICKAAFDRSIFTEIPEEEIFRNQLGDMVLNGAMGVDKFKEVDGVMVHHLRFIANLTPTNAYMRKLSGDSALLPQASHLSMMVLGPDEFTWMDGEDLQSCFNILYLEPCWRKFLVFASKCPEQPWEDQHVKLLT
jgi:hypothetical protein